MQPAARQNIRRHHQIQLALLQGRLRIKSDAGCEIHFYLRPACTEVFQRRGQPLNTAMTFNSDAQTSLLRFVARLQRTADLRQHLVCQLQQNFPLRRKAQRLAFTHEQAEAKALFQIAELMRQSGLSLVQHRSSSSQRSTIPQCLECFQMFNFDHESPSLRHEQIALEEYTVPLHYGCVNIQTSKTRHISTCRCVGFLAYPSHLLQ
ncbi:Uncharacterised protein [Salmonella enterica subsp. enterica serovar Typhi]|nr:Uncharacterised protein [Salmonella enterica subsp. enterica serovar Typhi]